MEIGKKFIDGEGDSFHVQRTFTNEPYLEKAAMMREQGLGMSGESRCIGVIPQHLLAQWLKEAGVDHSDTQAAEDVLKRKILSGDFDKFRVWKGTY